MPARTATFALLLLTLGGPPAASATEPAPTSTPATTPAPAPAPAPADDSATLAIGEQGQAIVTFARSAAAAGFSGAVLAAKDGQVIAATGVGFADASGTVPNTPATLFEIASLSKQFTAAAILRLQQDGKLNIDDPIATHLPGVPEDCSSITIAHLLHHTSGIPGGNSQGAGSDLAAVLPLFLKGGPRHTPGTRFGYWNQGYALLAEIITRASGQDYPAYSTHALFTPAGLRHTLFTGDAAPAGAVVAIGRSARGPSRSALDHPYGAYGFQYRGMGGVVTTVWDLFRWDRALTGSTVLNDAQRQRLFTPGLSEYALGWRITTNPTGRTTQSHGGAVRGFLAEMRRFPQHNACVIVLANADDAPVQQVAASIESLLFGEKPTWAPPVPLPADLAATLAGEYRNAQGRVVIIEPGAARIRILWGGSPSAGPVTRGTLSADAQGAVTMFDGQDRIPLTFTKGPDGRAATLSISVGPNAPPMTFTRTPAK
ncbi:MAG: serine hydrolase domain-containing protein [bacterium]